MQPNNNNNGQPPAGVPGPPAPMPLPMNWMMAPARDSAGRWWVAVQIAGPTGTFVSFLEPEVAEKVAEQLVAHARTAKSGLIVPGMGMPPGMGAN